MREDAAADGKLRVFVSYSRKDEAFAQELVAGLERDQWIKRTRSMSDLPNSTNFSQRSYQELEFRLGN